MKLGVKDGIKFGIGIMIGKLLSAFVLKSATEALKRVENKENEEEE